MFYSVKPSSLPWSNYLRDRGIPLPRKNRILILTFHCFSLFLWAIRWITLMTTGYESTRAKVYISIVFVVFVVFVVAEWLPDKHGLIGFIAGKYLDFKFHFKFKRKLTTTRNVWNFMNKSFPKNKEKVKFSLLVCNIK